MRPIEESGRFVALTDNYAPEMEMITSRLPKFPNSTDPDVVVIKMDGWILQVSLLSLILLLIS